MRKLLIWLFVAIGVGGVSFGAYKYFSKGSSTVATTTENKKTEVKEEELMQTEFDIPIDHTWEISFDDELLQDSITKENITIVNEEGESLEVVIALDESRKKILLSPPQGNYEKGAYYEIHMNDQLTYEDGTNVSKTFSMAFVTTRDEVETATYKDSLIFVEGGDVVSEKDNVLVLKKTETTSTYKKDDIIMIPHEEKIEGYHQAYRIVGVNEKGDEIIVTAILPEFNELFEELDIYKEYDMLSEDAVIIPAEGVTVEEITAYNPNLMLASDSEESLTRKGEYQVASSESAKEKSKDPKLSIDTTKGVKFKVENLKIGFEKESLYFDTVLHLKKPTMLFDYQLKYGELKKLNSVSKNELEASITNEVELSSKNFFEKYNKEIEEAMKKKKNQQNLFERDMPIATILVPTPIPYLFAEMDVSALVGFTPVNAGKANFVLKSYATTTVKQELGVVRKKGEFRPHIKFDEDVNTGISGKGKVALKVGGDVGAKISAGGLLGVGAELGAGAYAEGEATLGYRETNGTSESFDESKITINDISDQNLYFCSKGEGGLYSNASVVVDTVGNIELFEWIFARGEKKLLDFDTCKSLQEIKAFPEEISTESGEKVDVQLMGKEVDETTGKVSETELKITGKNVNNFTIKTLDKNIATAKLVQANKNKVNDPDSSKATYKLVVTAKKEPRGGETEIEVTYYDKSLEKEFTTTIPVFLEDQVKLTDSEVRNVMNIYLEMIEMRGLFTQEKEMYSPELVAPHIEELNERMKSFVTDNYLKENNQQQFLEGWIGASGEGDIVPKYDLRFQVLENSGKKVVVKSVIPAMIYGADYVPYAENVYVTAVKEKGKWLIDAVKHTRAPEDPANFTKAEIQKILDNSGMGGITYLGETTMNTDVGWNQSGPVTLDTNVYIYKIESTGGIDGITAASGNILYNMSLDELPSNIREKVQAEEANKSNMLNWTNEEIQQYIANYFEMNSNYVIVEVYERTDSGYSIEARQDNAALGKGDPGVAPALGFFEVHADGKLYKMEIVSGDYILVN